jgi:hypothetical protein
VEKGRHVRKKGERGVEVGGGRISVEQELVRRQISEAIPRNERLIARQARPEPAEGDAREDHQGGTEGGAAAGTPVRRSGRSRKPKERS